jgi:hypothetical protein
MMSPSHVMLQQLRQYAGSKFCDASAAALVLREQGIYPRLCKSSGSASNMGGEIDCTVEILQGRG